MRRTPFPTNPSDVVALTVPEFACALDLSEPVSLDSICQRLVGDTNRVLVWFIRFLALTAWCERTDVGVWLQSAPSHTQHACQLAASFALKTIGNSTSNDSVRPLTQSLANVLKSRS